MFKIIQRARGYRLGQGAFDELRCAGLSDSALDSLLSLKDKHYPSKKEFIDTIQVIMQTSLADSYVRQILKSAKVLQLREILRYIRTLRGYRFIRYNTLSNYLFNSLRFPKLARGKTVVINCHDKNNFYYGKNICLGDYVKLDIGTSKLRLADGVGVHNNCRLAPEKSGIKIGKRSRIQDFGRLSGEITIGEDVIIAPNFYASSGVHVFNKSPHLLMNLQDQMYDGLMGECYIEDDCWVGMNVCLMPGVRIRRGCVIGAGAIVTRTTEPYSIYAGVPARKIGTRLTLEPKTILDASIAENLPYFYQGFDHYNYLNYKDKLLGILTDATHFALYTELSNIKSVHLEIEPATAAPVTLKYKSFNFEIKTGINNIIINEIELIDKLLKLESTERLIIRKVMFQNI
ncbi:acyltransferase [Legionella maioricensis]|uniref:Acyltransferase n=1 Tax=Legionella maioricensis TaxID=2896528 RepID=A0A9X2D0F2_9GAMM|nr:acyltransferase [Legionella maioricensis]MCL9686861.1 acyltransferase [Legionella maioricensis]